MNSTKKALKNFGDLTSDIEMLLNDIENMPKPITDCNGNIVSYDDSFGESYNNLDEFISCGCDNIYEKHEEIFSTLKIDYELEKNCKYRIKIEAQIIFDYGELKYCNEFRN